MPLLLAVHSVVHTASSGRAALRTSWNGEAYANDAGTPEQAVTSFAMRLLRMKTCLRSRNLIFTICALAAALTLSGAVLLVFAEAGAPVRPTGTHPMSVSDPSGGTHSGRARCAGAVDAARVLNQGDAGDVLERIQAAGELAPGFLAVVHDGDGPIVVVERPFLEEWVARTAGWGVRAAPSCVPHEILTTTTVALTQIRLGPGEMTSAGYDAISDAMVVTSTFSDVEMLALLTSDVPSAQRAYTSGTLRLVQIPKGSITRQ